ncbi:MAG: hypothetical protein IKH11_06190 [Bacteroidales bacterium]|nr:hypothetical protein [Bacteroidales bacterium]
MEQKEIPELYTLLQKVQIKFGRPLEHTNDFRVLSALLEYECKEVVSVSTLKRLWGYVSQQTTPRSATLDVLSRFLGFIDFQDFRLSCFDAASDSSEYVNASCVTARDVPDGGMLTIGWAPNRLLHLKKVGEQEWEVTTSYNSKLLAGDRFESACFFKGLPLFLPSVLREGVTLPSYIAGKKDGLNVLSIDS